MKLISPIQVTVVKTYHLPTTIRAQQEIITFHFSEVVGQTAILIKFLLLHLGQWKLDSTSKIVDPLKNMRILKTKIDNLDQIWKILSAIKTNLQGMQHVVYLVSLMDTVENKSLSIVLKLSLLSSEKNCKRTHKICMLYSKQFSKRSIVNYP